MDKFTGKVLSFIRKNEMVPEGTTVIVGFSGGADSTALLNVLCDLKRLLKIEIVAVHINHGIRKEAADDESFAMEFCSSRGITFLAYNFDIPQIAKEKGLSEEEAGREARYLSFREVGRRYEKSRIAVAHHQNDVAETLIMNLTRGSGLKGGSAIRPVRDDIIRPLLCVSRSEIEEYLKDRSISFCTDKTNFENEHTRNVIRNRIMPLLETEVNKKAVNHLVRSAESFEKAEVFIRACSDKVYDSIVTRSGEGLSIKVEDISHEPDIIRENVILRCFEELVPSRKDISFSHVDAVLSLMDSSDGTASVNLPYSLLAKRSYGVLIIDKKENEKKQLPEIAVKLAYGEETGIDIPGLGRVYMTVLPMDREKDVPRDTYTKWFDYDRIQTVAFRPRRAGDVIWIDQNKARVRKQLSKYMTDAKIPQSERDNMYLLADGSDVLWIPGYRMSAAYKVDESTRNILSVKIKSSYGGISNG